MKRFLVVLISVSFVFFGEVICQTHTKISSYTKAMLSNYATSVKKTRSADSVPEYLSTFTKVKDSTAWPVLERAGCIIGTKIGQIATVKIPYDKVEELAASGEIDYIEAAPPIKFRMDSARRASNVLPVYEGKGLPLPYTGKGVLIGIIDCGFDYTHPNFYDPSGAKYRVKRVWQQEKSSKGLLYRAENEILNAKCSWDSKTETHGTHVAGIASGGGYTTPYKGVAYESDLFLVATTLSLSDVVDGVKAIFDYATEQQQPCVINMSFGAYIDPHDGTSLWDQSISQLAGPGRIISVSAGNAGNAPVFLQIEKGNNVRTVLFSGNKQKQAYLCADNTNKRFSIRIGLYDCNANRMIFESSNLSSDFNSTLLPGYSCSVSIGYSVRNKKNEMVLSLNTPNLSNDTVFTVQIISPETGVKGWTDGDCYFSDLDKPSLFARGSSDCTIGSPGTAYNVICVGAYNTRPGIKNLDGEILERPNYKLGELSSFSSHGPTVDGRIKPDVTAPGFFIVSSYNSYYMAAGGNKEQELKNMIEKTPFKGGTYPWGIMSGTSMSCPFVTGSIALWLQARPDLSPDDIRSIISRTSAQDKTMAYPNNLWGYGKLDVYRGLLDILGITSVQDTRSDLSAKDAVSVYPVSTPGCFHIRWAEQPRWFTVCVYDLNGSSVYKESVSKPTSIDYSVHSDSLLPGVYTVQVTTELGSVSRTLKLE